MATEYTVGLWNSTTGEPVDEITNVPIAAALAFSPNGALMAVAPDTSAGSTHPSLWSLASKKEVAELGTDQLSEVCFSPDGETVAAVTGVGRPRTSHTSSTMTLWHLT